MAVPAAGFAALSEEVGSGLHRSRGHVGNLNERVAVEKSSKKDETSYAPRSLTRCWTRLPQTPSHEVAMVLQAWHGRE